MDPAAPAQLIAWAVAAVLALFSLGGCADMKALDGSGRPFFDGPYVNYAAPPAYGRPLPPYWNAPVRQVAPGATCVRTGQFVFC